MGYLSRNVWLSVEYKILRQNGGIKYEMNSICMVIETKFTSRLCGSRSQTQSPCDMNT